MTVYEKVISSGRTLKIKRLWRQHTMGTYRPRWHKSPSYYVKMLWIRYLFLKSLRRPILTQIQIQRAGEFVERGLQIVQVR